MSRTLIQDLDALHATYVVAVNEAIAADDLASAEELALAYENDAIQLMAERENLTHLLPIQRGGRPESALRGAVRRLLPGRAA